MFDEFCNFCFYAEDEEICEDCQERRRYEKELERQKGEKEVKSTPSFKSLPWRHKIPIKYFNDLPGKARYLA
jgi:hypothetical protein